MNDPRMASSERASFFSQSAVLTVANGLSAVLSAAYVAFVGRRLGPAEYATVTAALSVSYLLQLVLGPLETGVAKFAADYHGAGANGKLATLTYSTLRRLRLPVTAGLAGFVVLIPALERALSVADRGALGALGLYAAACLYASVPRGTLRGDHRFTAYGYNQVAESVVRLVGGAGLVWAGVGATGAVAGYAAGMSAALAIGLYQLRDLRRAPALPDPVDEAGLYAFSGPLFFVYGYFLFVTNVDMLTAKRGLPPDAAGVYGSASALARVLYLGATPIYQVLFARVSAKSARGESARELTRIALGVVTIGLGVSNLLPWLFGEPLLVAVFGPRFAGGGPVLRVLWATTSILILQSMVVFVLLGIGRVRGAWTLFFPCAVMATCLWAWHDSTLDVARAGLYGALAGSVPIGALWIGGRRAPAADRRTAAKQAGA
jgi:O-antigen/teichoic acid export membrane protein